MNAPVDGSVISSVRALEVEDAATFATAGACRTDARFGGVRCHCCTPTGSDGNGRLVLGMAQLHAEFCKLTGVTESEWLADSSAPHCVKCCQLDPVVAARVRSSISRKRVMLTFSILNEDPA